MSKKTETAVALPPSLVPIQKRFALWHGAALQSAAHLKLAKYFCGLEVAALAEGGTLTEMMGGTLTEMRGGTLTAMWGGTLTEIKEWFSGIIGTIAKAAKILTDNRKK